MALVCQKAESCNAVVFAYQFLMTLIPAGGRENGQKLGLTVFDFCVLPSISSIQSSFLKLPSLHFVAIGSCQGSIVPRHFVPW